MEQKKQGEVIPNQDDHIISRTKELIAVTSFEDLYEVLVKRYQEYPSLVQTLKEVRDSKRSILDIPDIPGLRETVGKLLAGDNQYQAPTIRLG